MDHMPIRDWLSSDEPLSPEQSVTLRRHLQKCDDCQHLENALTDVQRLFQSPPQANPAPGFSIRWKERLTERQLKRQHRIAWVAIGAIAMITVVLFFILGTQVWSIVQSPEQLFLVWVSRLVIMLGFLYQAKDFFTGLLNIAPSIPVSLLVISFAIGITSFFTAIWLVTYKQLIVIRRRIK